MQRFRLYGLYLLVIMLLGCSNDNSGPSGAEQETVPDFQIIGQDGNSIYLYTSSNNNTEQTNLNLTAQSGVNRQYITLRQTEDLLSFFSFASGSFSLVIHDADNNTSSEYPNFYSVDDERSIIWGSNSENQIFLGFYSPRGTRNYNVRILDPISANFSDLQIADNTTQVFQPLYSNGRLVLPYRDSSGNYQVAVMDTDNATVIETYDYDTSATSVFLDRTDELVVLSSTDQENYQYNFYDLQTAIGTREGSFQLSKYFPPGPVDANFSNNKLYYFNFFAQPYPITSGPAFFDLNSQEDVVIDILGIKQEIETEIGSAIDLTDMHFLENANLFAVGYAEADNRELWQGGVILIYPEGDKISRIELPFVPTYVVRE